MAVKFLLDRERKRQEDMLKEILNLVKKKPAPTIETEILADFINALYAVGQKGKKAAGAGKEAEEEPRKTTGRAIRPSIMTPAVTSRLATGDSYAGAVKGMQESMLTLEESKNNEGVAGEKSGGHEIPVAESKAHAPAQDQAWAAQGRAINAQLPAPPKPHRTCSAVPKRSEYLVKRFGTPVGVTIDKNEDGNWKYTVVEPRVDNRLVRIVKERIKSDFAKNPSILDDEEKMKKTVAGAARTCNIEYSPDLYRKVMYYVKRDLTGFRRIDIPVHDTQVKAVYVDGINKPVRLDVANFPPKIESNIIFDDSADLQVLINRIALSTGHYLTKDKPILNTSFEGFKIHATLGVGGVSSKLTIRRIDVENRMEANSGAVNPYEREDKVAIRDYVKYAKHFGFNDDEIKSSLKGAGWKDEEIFEAFADFTEPKLKGLDIPVPKPE